MYKVEDIRKWAAHKDNQAFSRDVVLALLEAYDVKTKALKDLCEEVENAEFWLVHTDAYTNAKEALK